MSLYESSVKRPIMTSLIFIGVIILGLFSLSKLPIDLLPDIEPNVLMVVTNYNGASALDIENNVTRPLENTLNTVENLKNIRSTSKENTSVVIMEFEFGYDLDVLANDVRDKLELVKPYLPEAASNPVIFKFSTDMIPIMMISATADKSLPALYKILDDNVANPLARINGVGSVSINGAPEREIQVYVDPVKLEAYHLTIESIGQNIRLENVNTPSGSMDLGSKTYTVRVQGEFTNPADINKVVVGTSNGKNVYLSDIAVVNDGHQERVQESYTNGVQGATIVIQKQSGANTVAIANAIREKLPEIEKALPSDVKLNIINDTSDNIKNTIAGLEETILYAFLFVVLVVLFFLGRWRATIIIILTIPISLIAAFIYLAATGGTLNIISLSSLSIAIGMVVDDAIVVLENITKHIEKGSRPSSAAIHGTNEVATAIVASTLTIVAVFFPLTLVGGLAGILFDQLGWMVTIIIIISMICALSLTPMLSSNMLRLDPHHSRLFTILYAPIEKFLDNLDTWYANIVNWTVRHRWQTVAMAAGFFILSLLPLINIGTEYIPAQDNSRISASIELPVGTRMEITKQTASNLTRLWQKKYPEIETINYSVGQASSTNIIGSIQNSGSNIISFTLRLSDVEKRDKTIFQIADSMRNDLKSFLEISKSSVTAGGNMGTMGGQSTLDVEIYGYDFEKTDQVAKELVDRIGNIHGLVNTTISRGDYSPEYQVEFDRDKLALNGLNISTASTFLRNRINGLSASLYREEGDEYTIRVVYAPEYRQSVEDVENILIYNSMGQAIRLKDLGKVVETLTPPFIQRKNRERVITVSSTISGTTIDKGVQALKAEINKMNIPDGVDTVITGSYEDQQESFSDLTTLLLIIIMLVYIVMASQFESLTYPFIIMFGLPFALSGVVLALFMTGGTINMMSMIGIIMLVGIVVKNGIVLVDYINLNRERGMGIIRAIVSGGRSRLRPVLMTTATTILGMIPLAVSSSQGSEIWKPMAVTIIGGLTVSTILTLLIVPTLYSIFAGFGIKRNYHKYEKEGEKTQKKAKV
jgi:HAE1 family hydrophobic/amphiphilic exporter-1